MSRVLSRLKLVRVGRPVAKEAAQALADRIREAFDGAVTSLQLVDYEPPAVDRIDAALLTQALEQEVGGHILGITDLDLVDEGSDDFFNFLFGCKDNRNHVAVVSTRRIAAVRSASSGAAQRLLARLLKVALHEIGHNFGLVHHYAYPRTARGGCCPMTKGDYNRHGERSYVRSVIDARGFHFCAACRRFLRLAHASART